MLLFRERRKLEYLAKTSRSEEESQQKTQPKYGVDAAIWTRATLVGGECSHHRTLTAKESLRGSRNLEHTSSDILGEYEISNQS